MNLGQMVNSKGENGMRWEAAKAAPKNLASDFEHHLQRQKQLCLDLEAVADVLPKDNKINPNQKAIDDIEEVLGEAHSFEENVLFPFLRYQNKDQPDLAATLERLRYENWEDESYAAELSDAIEGLRNGKGAFTSESLGYMLRGFFGGLRRHIAFEREHLMPYVLAAQSKSKKST